MKTLAIATIAALSLSACTTVAQTTGERLPGGLTDNGGGVYSASELGAGNYTPIQLALGWCKRKGKPLKIMTSTSEKGWYSGKQYATIIFTCEG